MLRGTSPAHSLQKDERAQDNGATQAGGVRPHLAGVGVVEPHQQAALVHVGKVLVQQRGLQTGEGAEGTRGY